MSARKMMGEECVYDNLGLDEACVYLSGKKSNESHEGPTLYSLSSDCITCPYSRLSAITPGRNISLTVNTARSVTWRVYNETEFHAERSANDESGLLCQLRPDLGEYGVYRLSMDDEDRCRFDTLLAAHNSYTPLGIILGSVLSVLLAVALARACLRRWRELRRSGETKSEAETAGEGRARRRVLSIDTFRGISILMMIFVNNGAGGYAFLEHATWNGLLVGDLVFPCFVWIMGLCVPIALSSQLARGTSRWALVRRILKRSVALFLIDLSVNTLGTGADLRTIRIFGVLQRFAVAYAVIGLLYALLSPRKETRYPAEDRGRSVSLVASTIADVYPLATQWMGVLAITALHCALTFLLPLPGCPTGYLGPGGRHEEGRYRNCTGGAAGYVDALILGRDHVYQRPTIDSVYGSGPFDPEGILGSLTTILQTFLGVQAGKILRIHGDWRARVTRWLAMSLGCGLLGCALHFSRLIPVNKNLWSLSFVLTTTSFAQVLFVACYLLIDVSGLWRGGPFRIPGMNALVMYVGHRMCHSIFPFHWKYGAEWPESHAWRTIAALWDVGAWTLVAYVLHRKRIYVSL